MIGLVIFLDVAPAVEEVALEDLYGAPAPFLAETPATTTIQSQLTPPATAVIPIGSLSANQAQPLPTSRAKNLFC